MVVVKRGGDILSGSSGDDSCERESQTRWGLRRKAVTLAARNLGNPRLKKRKELESLLKMWRKLRSIRGAKHQSCAGKGSLATTTVVQNQVVELES